MSKLNCFDEMLFTAGKVLLPDCNIYYYFLESFSVKYIKSYIVKPTSVETEKKESTCVSLLKDYYGFCVTREIAEDNAFVERKIEDTLRFGSKIIGIQMDEFYLPWGNIQFQMHRTHYFLITDIINDSYICVDAFLSKDKVLIDKETLLNYVECLFSFEYNEGLKKRHSLKNIIEYLQSYISSEFMDHVELIEEFATMILSSDFNTIQHTNYNNIEESSIIFSIANIEWSRKNFSNALKLVKDDYNTSVFDHIILTLDEVYTMWGKVEALMIKSFFLHNCGIKASELLKTVAEKEKKVMELILNIHVPT